MITSFSFDQNLFKFETSTMNVSLNLQTGELIYNRKENSMTGNEMKDFLNNKLAKKEELKISNAFADDSDSDISEAPDISDAESIDEIYHAPVKE